MVLWKNKFIIIFGGAATYLKSCKLRVCLSDLFVFDTHKGAWKKIPEEDLTPIKRMNHVAGILENYMIVHGGSNNETK